MLEGKQATRGDIVRFFGGIANYVEGGGGVRGGVWGEGVASQCCPRSPLLGRYRGGYSSYTVANRGFEWVTKVSPLPSGPEETD